MRWIGRVAVLWGGTGCGYYWALQESIDTGCGTTYAYYLDDDGDGWGVGEPVEQCGPDPQTGFTSLNNRDCDDANELVTGRTGSVCPDELVVGGSEYTAVVHSNRDEFVAVHSRGTALVWATEAEVACGPWGWGGALASFDGQDDLNEVEQALENLDIYAGFVNAGWDDASSSWVWLDGSGLDFNSVGWCFGTVPEPVDFNPALDAESKTYAAEIDQLRIALVKREQGWCFGEPGQAIPVGTDTGALGKEDYPPYLSAKDGHFICERAVPDPLDYAPPEALDVAVDSGM